MSEGKANKPNRKAIISMKKVLNLRKRKNELEGLDEVIFSDKEDEEVEQEMESIERNTMKDNADAKDKNLEIVEVIEHEEEEDEEGAAWEDEDDVKVSVDLRINPRLRKLRKTEEESEVSGLEYAKRLRGFYNERLKNSSFYGWAFDENGEANAKLRSEEEEFERNPNGILENMLRREYSVYSEDSRPENLLADVIEMERIGQTPVKTKHNAVVQEVEFHPNSEIFFTAGLDKLVKIYTVRENRPAFRDNVKLLKQLYLEGMPVLSAHFLPGKNEIIACGMKKHLLCYNLISDKIEKVSSHLFTQRFDQKIDNFVLSPDGNYLALYSEHGYLMILNARTKQFLFELKMNEACSSLAFSHDSKFLFSAGKLGKIYQWELSKRAIFDVMQDQGTQASTAIKVSPNGEYVATSSPTGIVNIYNYNKTTNTLAKQPTKEVQNLTTSVDTLAFNAQSEILLTASKWKKNAIRLVHLPTFNVFQNWPNFKTQLKLVTAAAFSPNGKYMALSNDAGLTYLYNFKHYS